MAPEVAKYLPYGLSADVYSYGILLWEILHLSRPFGNLRTFSAVYERVVEDGARPPLKNDSSSDQKFSWPAPRHVRTLLRRCWAENQAERPCFGAVERAITKERMLLAVAEEEDESLLRRRVYFGPCGKRRNGDAVYPAAMTSNAGGPDRDSCCSCHPPSPESAAATAALAGGSEPLPALPSSRSLGWEKQSSSKTTATLPSWRSLVW